MQGPEVAVLCVTAPCELALHDRFRLCAPMRCWLASSTPKRSSASLHSPTQVAVAAETVGSYSTPQVPADHGRRLRNGASAAMAGSLGRHIAAPEQRRCWL